MSWKQRELQKEECLAFCTSASHIDLWEEKEVGNTVLHGCKLNTTVTCSSLIRSTSFLSRSKYCWLMPTAYYMVAYCDCWIFAVLDWQQKKFFVFRFSKILVQMCLNLLLKVIMPVFLHMDRLDLGSPTPWWEMRYVALCKCAFLLCSSALEICVCLIVLTNFPLHHNL